MIEKSYSFCYTNHVYSHIILNAGQISGYVMHAPQAQTKAEVTYASEKNSFNCG